LYYPPVVIAPLPFIHTDGVDMNAYQADLTECQKDADKLNHSDKIKE
jgi:hypothetical protein